MKHKKMVLFFFFTVFLTSLIIPLSHAGVVADPVVDVDVLSVQLGSFQDDTTGDGSGKFKKATGGYDLLSFINYGEYSRDLENDKILYRARAKFGFEVNVWTATTYQDILPDIDIWEKEKQIFFSYQHWDHFMGCIFPKICRKVGDTDFYTFEYRIIDFGDSYKRHDYCGVLPMVVTIDPGVKFKGEITLEGTTFSIPKLTADIINVEITEARGGECGSYEDYYTDEGISEGKVNLEVLGGITCPKSTKKIVDWFNKQNVGFRSYSTIQEGGTIQQGIRDEGCDGTVFSDPEAYEQISFNLPVHIQPRVEKFKQMLRWNRGYVSFFECCNKFKGAAIVEKDKVWERDVSVHVYNQFVHYDFEMEVDLFMTCEFKGEISKSFLSDPDLKISDMLWNNDIVGTEDVDYIFPPKLSIWTIFILLILVCVGIIIIACVYKYYKSKRSRTTVIVKR